MRRVLLIRDVSDNGWTVTVPSLPGCISEGNTREEAIRNISDAIAAWIDAAEQVGKEVPCESPEAELLSVPID